MKDLIRYSLNRRELLKLGALSVLGYACGDGPSGGNEPLDPRLVSRPISPNTTLLTAGQHNLGLGTGRDGWIYIPSTTVTPRPLIVFLHGAGGDADFFELLQPLADTYNFVMLAIDSRSTTWDVIQGDPGPDVEFIDQAITRVMQRTPILGTKIGLAGFSDGASYSLTLGLGNGDLFTHVFAFAPGFLLTGPRRGTPKIYVTHGTNDAVLPIDQTSRIIVPTLQSMNYTVVYTEFNGGHTVNATLAEQAFADMVA